MPERWAEHASVVSKKLRALPAAAAEAGADWFTDDHARIMTGVADDLAADMDKFWADDFECHFVLRGVQRANERARKERVAREAAAAAEDDDDDEAAPPPVKRSRVDLETAAVDEEEESRAIEARTNELWVRMGDLAHRCRQRLCTATGVAKHATGMRVDGVFHPWVNEDVRAKCLEEFPFRPEAPEGYARALGQEADALRVLLCEEVDRSALEVKVAVGGVNTFEPSADAVVFAVHTDNTAELLACVGLLRVEVAVEGEAAGLPPLVASAQVDGRVVRWTVRVPVALTLLQLHVTAVLGDDVLARSTARPVPTRSCDGALGKLGGRPWHEWSVYFASEVAMYVADPVYKTVRVMELGNEDAPVRVFYDASVESVLCPVSQVGTMTMNCGGGGPQLEVQWRVSVSCGHPIPFPVAVWREVGGGGGACVRSREEAKA